jgi:hypothetical protein
MIYELKNLPQSRKADLLATELFWVRTPGGGTLVARDITTH